MPTPPGNLDKLNFRTMFSVQRKLWNLSPFVDFKQPLNSCLKRLCIVCEYYFWTPPYYCKFLKILMSACVVRLGANSKFTALTQYMRTGVCKIKLCVAFRSVVNGICVVFSYNLNWHWSVRSLSNGYDLGLGYGIDLYILHLKQCFMIVFAIFLSDGIQCVIFT